MASRFILWERITRTVVGDPVRVFATSGEATTYLKRAQAHSNNPGEDKKIYDTVTVTVP